MEDNIKSFYSKIVTLQKKIKTLHFHTHYESKIKTALINESEKEMNTYAELYALKKTYDNIENGIIYKIEYDHSNYFNEAIRYNISYLIKYLKKSPHLLFKILRKCNTCNSRKTISNFIYNNFFANPFSNKSIEDEFLLIITGQLYSDLNVSNNPTQFYEKITIHSATGNLFKSLFDNFEIANFIGNILDRTFHILETIKEEHLLFDFKKLIDTLNKTKNIQIENISKKNEFHYNAINKMFLFKPSKYETPLNEYESFSLINEISANCESINYDNLQKTELGCSVGLSINKLKQILAETTDENMKIILNSFIAKSKINEMIFSNIFFHNLTSNLSNGLELSKLHTKYALIIISIIESIVSYFEKNILLIPISIRYICKIISELVKSKFKNSSITEIEENNYVKVFLIDCLINYALENPEKVFLIYKGNITEKIILVCQEVKYIMDVLFKCDLFRGNKKPQYTIFNYYFLQTFPKIFRIYSSIKQSVQLPSFIRNYISELNSKEEFGKYSFSYKLNLQDKFFRGIFIISSYEEIKVLIEKINELYQNKEISYKEIEKLMPNIVNPLLKEMNNIDHFISLEKENNENKYFLFKANLSLKINKKFTKDSNIINDNKTDNRELKDFFIDVLSTFSVFPIDMFYQYQINSIRSFISSLNKLNKNHSCLLLSSNESFIIVDYLFDLYSSISEENKQKIEQNILNELNIKINEQLGKYDNFNSVKMSENINIIQRKISELNIMIIDKEDWLISTLAKMIIEQFNICLGIKSQGLFSSKYIFSIEHCSTGTKSSKKMIISENIKEFCEAILQYPIDYLIPTSEQQKFFTVCSKEQIPNELKQTFTFIISTIEEMNIEDFYLNIKKCPLPKLGEMRIKYIKKMISKKVLNYIYNIISNVLLPPIQLEEDKTLEKVMTYLRKITPEQCGLVLNTVQLNNVNKINEVFLKFSKMKVPYEIFSFIFRIVEYLKITYNIQQDRIQYKLLLFLITKCGSHNFYSIITYLQMYCYNLSEKEKEIFDMLNNAMKCLIEIGNGKLKGISTQEEYEQIEIHSIDFKESYRDL